MSVAGMAPQHTPGASDIELVRAARAQDGDAFEELYRRYHAPVASFVRRYVRDDGRAEDVAQDAFVSAFRRIRQTESEIHFEPWIYKIARHAAIDHHRRSSRAEEVPFDADGGLAGADGRRLTAAGAPETSVIAKERFENFRGALDELSETHHRIIVLREFEGLSYREIGARMQLSPPAVESALVRARRRLASEYEQLETGRRCALIGTVMARLAEGVESGRDRRRLDRHARRCWSCRRRARELGVGPSDERPAPRRALALLPLPAFLRRLGPDGAPTASGREAVGAVTAPGIETAVQGAHKAVALLASAIAIGGAGATLGGVGPLALDPGRVPTEEREPSRDAGAATGTDGGASVRTRSSRRPASRPGSDPAGGRSEPRGGEPAARAPRSPSAPSSRAPARSALPTLTEPPAARPPAPDVRLPTLLPQRSRPVLPVSPRLPGLPDVPPLPDLPSVPGVGTGQVGSVVPDVSETVRPPDDVLGSR